MKASLSRTRLFGSTLVAALCSLCFDALPQGTEFTYQGQLASGGTPATGIFDLQFSAFETSTGGNPIAGPLLRLDVGITNGLFTVTLDFGTGVFTGANRWLEVGVRTNGAALFTPLAPRHKIQSAPYAQFAFSGNQGPPGDSHWLVNGSATYYNAGNVGIGTSTPLAPLTVQPAFSMFGIEHSDGVRRLSTYLDVNGCWFGSVTPDKLLFYVNNGAYPSMTVDLSGRVGIGTMNPAWPLDILANQAAARLVSEFSTFGSVIELKNTTTSPTMIGAINFNDATGSYPGQIGYLGTHDMTFRNAGAERMRIAPNGNIGIGTASPTERLHLLGNFKTGGRIMVDMNSTGDSPQLELRENQDGDFARLRLQSGTRAYWDIAAGGGAPNVLNIFNTNYGNVVSITPNGMLSTKVLTITGGADLAEPFAMSQRDLPKGAVVVIDEDAPGHLKLSTEPYDRRVAGVISGAGGVNTGLSLSQHGVMEGDQHVALTGRVYVQADATQSPIKPGDLLTTSSRPGHAMKASDPARAQGAILGKAMTGLKDEKGLVLVLVTLQ